MNRTLKGFSLIELMVVVTIFAIISMIALPMYTDMVRESRRHDGASTLMSIEQQQELYRTNNTTYGGLGDVWTGNQTGGGYYTLAITNNTGTGYTLTATANGDQANDDEGAVICNPLQIQVSALQTNRTPAACW